jgi:phage terminase Nu1 subunit (DNA packaging protein)
MRFSYSRMIKASSFPPQLTTDQLCTLIGVTRTHIARLERDGIVEKLGPGRYAVSSVPRYIASLRARSNMANRYGLARTLKMEEQAARARLDRLAREGELVSLEEITAAWSILTTNIRSNFLRLPTAAVPRLQAKTPAEQFGLLTDLVRQILTELSETKYVPTPGAEAAE